MTIWCVLGTAAIAVACVYLGRWSKIQTAPVIQAVREDDDVPLFV